MGYSGSAFDEGMTMVELGTGQAPKSFAQLVSERVRWFVGDAGVVSEAALAKLMGTTPQSLHQWKKGTRPQDVDAVLRGFAAALRAVNDGRRGRKRLRFPDHVSDVRLRNAYGYPIALERHLEYRVADMADTTAFGLRVHRAVGPPRPDVLVPDGRPGSDRLPRFLSRQHDERLRTVLRSVRDAMPERAGRAFVVLVGKSSTGKTRSAFEAVRAELGNAQRHWTLLRPQDPEDLRDILSAAGGVAPRTVLWLDELDGFLRSSAGATAARRLSGLLEDHNTGPFVAIGTCWPGRWAAMAQGPAEAVAQDADASSVAKLLAMVRDGGYRIDVPETFDRHTDLPRVEEYAREGDPHWQLALLAHADPRRTADRWRLTQILAGGPQLLDWYRNHGTARPGNQDGYSPYPAAVVSAAIDAFRLGCRTPLQSEHLKAAAQGYLRDSDIPAPPDWFGPAVEAATRELTVGGVAPLAQGFDGAFLPADFLIQSARRPCSCARQPCGCRRLAPRELWDVLVQAAAGDDADLKAVTRVAMDRGLREVAARLCLTAIDTRDSRAAKEHYADIIHTTSFAGHEAWTAAARATVTPDPVAQEPAEHAGAYLEPPEIRADSNAAGDAGDWSDGFNRYQHELRYADASALIRERSEKLEASGRIDEAVAIWVQSNLPPAARNAAAVLLRHDRFEAASALLRGAAAGGDVWARQDLISALIARDRHDDAIELQRTVVAEHSSPDQNPDFTAAHELARLMQRAERVGEAVQVWYSCLYDGDPTAPRELLRLCDAAQHADIMRRAVEAGTHRWGRDEPLHDLVELLAGSGLDQEAGLMSRFGIHPGGKTNTGAAFPFQSPAANRQKRQWWRR
ncbi:ATP-binding protein [Streptomyces sp. NBC_00162]|uniref:ATP-binding protein n=1 Tax=Streptomyces sp. NBC_00162 TaxID=2903629 RepID=UPI00214C686A|nr:ATP-binding protein [Streptomyces sp. NBC_00162]UUU37765.1 ATP-binding protein [Streptomyces sp. NBC_00162]